MNPEIVKEIDETILHICKKIRTNNYALNENSADMISALAKLIMSRTCF